MERGALKPVERQLAVVLTPSAVVDLSEATAVYRHVGDDLAPAFVQAVDQLLERLQAFPNSGTPAEDLPGVRRARLRRFPYGVFYRVTPDEIRVLRVLHERRDRSDALR